MNHLFVCNHLFVFWWITRCVNPGIVNCQLTIRLSRRKYRKFPHPIIFSIFSCICNTISSVDCCIYKILQFSFLFNIFMFGGYIILHWHIILFIFNLLCYAVDPPKNNQCERLDLELMWTPKVCVNHNIGIFWTTHWYVNHLFFWMNHQVCKHRHFQLLNHQKFEHPEIYNVTASKSILNFFLFW